jgi:ferrochelatase
MHLVQEQLTPAFQAKGFTAPKTYLAMRYWHPFLEEALAQIQADGITHLMLMPLYPHYCLATTGSSLREFSQLLSQPKWHSLANSLNIATVCSYYKEPRFLEAVASTIQKAFDEKSWNAPLEERHVVFSAHGIPKDYAQQNKDPYPTQIRESCELLMQQYFPHTSWEICWQSRVGPLEWLKPYTEDLAEDLAQAGRDNVLMVPISFVSDHIETLFEMDMLYVPVGEKYGLAHWHRAESLNEHPIFVDLLSELCLRLLDSPLLCKVQFPDDLSVPKAPKICATLHSRATDLY